MLIFIQTILARLARMFDCSYQTVLFIPRDPCVAEFRWLLFGNMRVSYTARFKYMYAMCVCKTKCKLIKYKTYLQITHTKIISQQIEGPVTSA